jgi:hypothetical protein
MPFGRTERRQKGVIEIEYRRPVFGISSTIRMQTYVISGPYTDSYRLVPKYSRMYMPPLKSVL